MDRSEAIGVAKWGRGEAGPPNGNATNNKKDEIKAYCLFNFSFS